MGDNSQNNYRIARNTLFLYIRMAFVLIVSLYTSRVVLNTLGVVDYGVNNVVAGFVSMFSFLNGSLSGGIQRFYNYEIGKGTVSGESHVYTTAFRIQVLLALVVIALLETFGVWYLHHVLVVPPERFFAARILFQCSLLSLVLVILEIPYSAAIMAHEKLDYYAIVGILDVLLKLGLILMLPHLPYDKLIAFAGLSLLLHVINFALYFVYAKIKFKGLVLLKERNKSLFKQMLSFSGWNIMGTFAFMLKGQGVNMLLNFYFGPIINAARGIASQILTAIQGFSTNISTAFRPQIVQSYARDDHARTKNLMFSESKLCFIMLAVLIIPLLLEIKYVLHLWLGDIYPDYTIAFTSLVLLDMLVCSLNTPFTQIAYATGAVKPYQITTSVIHLALVGFSWLALRIGYGPISVFIVSVAMAIVNQTACVFVMNRYFRFGIRQYLGKVIIPCLLLLVLIPIIPGLIRWFMPQSFFRLVLVCVANVIMAFLIAYLIVFNKDERNILLKFIKRK